MKQNKKNYNGFARIDKLIGGTAKKYHLESEIYRYKAIKAWQEIADVFVEGVKDLTRATDFKNGVLKVACLSREVASQIKALSQRIIYAINEMLGKQLVYAIQVES